MIWYSKYEATINPLRWIMAIMADINYIFADTTQSYDVLHWHDTWSLWPTTYPLYRAGCSLSLSLSCIMAHMHFKDLEDSVNACRVYSLETVPKVWLICLFIFFAIYIYMFWTNSPLCVKMMYFNFILSSSTNRKYQPFSESYFPMAVCFGWLHYHGLSVASSRCRKAILLFPLLLPSPWCVQIIRNIMTQWYCCLFGHYAISWSLRRNYLKPLNR